MKRENDLLKLYQTLVVKSGWVQEQQRIVDKIRKYQDTYEEVEKLTGVPWQVIGAIHWMEASGSFSYHLHNGDPLTRRTVHVPAGRPKTGNPPFRWSESAVDALRYDGLDKHPWGRNKGADLLKIELFNGPGYIRKGVNSPYLWSGSQHYDKGKYVADGKWSPTAVSKQLGAAVILKGLQW